ncbi:MAG: hypothetical protein IJ740_09870 [Ruminococcus sp.]|nr:hypothetical protein [Ruminococcus sp.]
MNENFEKYIKDLSPELQEKARACKTKEELNAFIAENDLELPEDALEMVAGGCGTCSHTNAPVETVSFWGKNITYEGLALSEIEKSKCTKCGGNIAYAAVCFPELHDNTNNSHVSMYLITMNRKQITEAQYNQLKAKA